MPATIPMTHATPRSRHTTLALLLCCALVQFLHGESGHDATYWAARRLEWLQAHPIRIIFNNDGGDLSLTKQGEGMEQNFLTYRHQGLLDKKVDVICYTTQTAPIGITCTESALADTFWRNATGRNSEKLKEMRRQGSDPLKASLTFAHQHGMLSFWGLRMNDCHDIFTGCEDLFAPWKRLHPELLVGSADKRPPYAYWSALDYGRPEVRKLTVDILREGLENYDVDGLDLDFCRHWCLFKSAAAGGRPSEAECDALTEMMRRIRQTADAVSERRQRPLFIHIRVMDSVEACRAMGIDLPRWCREGLVDMVSGGSEVRLNQPDYWADVAHEFPNVRFYMTLTESQIQGENPVIQRNLNPLNYRAQAAAAWQAGVTGIHAFNQYYPSHASSIYLSEIDNPGNLSKLNKMYHFSQVFLPAGRFGNGWERFQKCPTLTPAAAQALPTSAPLKLPLYLGHEAPGAQCTLLLDLRNTASDGITVACNDTALPPGRNQSGLLAFNVPADILHPGLNMFAVQAADAGAPESVLVGDKILVQNENQGTWRRLYGAVGFVYGKSEAIQGGGYLLADISDIGISNLARPLESAGGGTITIDFEAKCLAASTPEAALLRLANGVGTETLYLAPDGVSLKYAKKRHAFAANEQFHRYTIVLRDHRLELYLDGDRKAPVLSADMTTPVEADHDTVVLPAVEPLSWLERDSLLIGSLSREGTGAVLYRNMTIAHSNASATRLYDGALLVVHDTAANDLPAILAPRVQPDSQASVRTTILRPKELAAWQQTMANKDNLKIQDDCILIDSRRAGPVLRHEFPEGEPAPVIQVDFDFRPLEQDCPKGQLQVAVFVNDRGNGTWLAGYRLHLNGVQFLDETKQPYPDGTNGIVHARLLLDTRAGLADLYIGNAPEPVLRNRCFAIAKRTAQAISVGDGSVAVEGRCEIHAVIVTEHL